ncbi:MAG: polymer-forming cytoskeletal protein [Caldilineaceae bacterium]|nr:polymer-forming cytoskeletal protein [Caldilineaceae bacterium]
MKLISRNGRWLAGVAVVTLLTLAVLFNGSTEPAAAAGSSAGIERPIVIALFDQQIFNEDFTVESGEVVDESVTVFRGNVEIEEGGTVNGDLSVFSGDVQIAGTLNGDLAVIGGEVELEDTARITGDVSVVGGNLDRAEGAYIGGNFVGGPRGDFENFERLPDVDVQPNVRVETPRADRDRPYILSFFLRLLQSILWTLLITGLVVLLSWLFPRQLAEVRKTGEEQPALSFAVGLVTALAVLLVGAILAVTVCLLPFSVLLWALLALVTLVGWAVLSAWLGDQIRESLGSRLSQDAHPLIPIALGALLLTGATFFAWSLLPCIGWIVALLLGATGNGAVLVHLARRTNIAGSSFGAASTGTATGSGPSTVVVRDPSRTDATSETVAAPAPQPAAEKSTDAAEPAEDAATPTQEEAAQMVTGDELGLTDEQRRQLREGAGIETTPSEPDDFTKIRGIGPAFNRRLLEAGITAYAQLAAMTPEQIAGIVGWPPERVVRDQLREQAATLAEQNG